MCNFAETRGRKGLSNMLITLISKDRGAGGGGAAAMSNDGGLS